mgnify:CR=1 FL=1
MSERRTAKDDCKYWQTSCELCGVTGNDYCPRKCKDYDVNAYDYEEDIGHENSHGVDPEQ